MANILIWHGDRSLSELAKRVQREISRRFPHHRVYSSDFWTEGFDPESPTAWTEELSDADLLVVLLGLAHEWKPGRHPWQDHSENAFCRAVARASDMQVPVLPVLIDGGILPESTELPVGVKGLSDLQPVIIPRQGDGAGLQQLMDRIEVLVSESTEPLLDHSRPEATAIPPAEPKTRSGFKDACIHWLKRIGRRFSAPGTTKASQPPVERGGLGDREDIGLTDVDGIQDVLLGASAPAALRPGDECTIRFAAYLEKEEAEMEQILHHLSPRSSSHLGIKRCRWQPGTHVTVHLYGRWLEVEDSLQSFVWDGARILLDFDARVSSVADKGVTIVKFDVFIEGIRVAKLRMDLPITDAVSDEMPRMVKARSVRSLFASYSSKDRQRVLDRIASIRISAGFDIFMDCLSIRPGEEWKPRIAMEIRSRDQFLLFWSHHAAESEWVSWEWKTALVEKGRQGMQIHPLENNALPPAELADLHFGDVFMAIRKDSVPGKKC
jgi:hypothetical protein